MRTNFSNPEMNFLLNILNDVVPIGTEWKEVKRRHHQHYPELDRSLETLKRKFRYLYNSRPQTGNPIIPDEVRKAKNILEENKSKQNVSDREGSGGSNFETRSSGSSGEGGGTVILKKRETGGGGRGKKKQKQDKEELDLIQYLVLENTLSNFDRFLMTEFSSTPTYSVLPMLSLEFFYPSSSCHHRPNLNNIAWRILNELSSSSSSSSSV